METMQLQSGDGQPVPTKEHAFVLRQPLQMPFEQMPLAHTLLHPPQLEASVRMSTQAFPHAEDGAAQMAVEVEMVVVVVPVVTVAVTDIETVFVIVGVVQVEVLRVIPQQEHADAYWAGPAQAVA